MASILASNAASNHLSKCFVNVKLVRIKTLWLGFSIKNAK